LTPDDFVINSNLPEEEVREAKEFFDAALKKYYGAIKRGLSPDDARMYIPGSVMSEITWTVNLRALRNFLKIRSKPDAMWEMRLLSQLIAKCFVERDMEFLVEDIMEIESC
jgi:thymidylate synthase (FAD)